MFKDKCSDSVLGQYSTKSLYNLLLDSDDHVMKIVERNVDIDFSVLFNNISDKFIDKFSIDFMHIIIHEILPVNNRLYKDFVLYCPNTLSLHLSLNIFNTFHHFLRKGDKRLLCGTDSDAILKFKSLNL
jgi:hypothetical protein